MGKTGSLLPKGQEVNNQTLVGLCLTVLGWIVNVLNLRKLDVLIGVEFSQRFGHGSLLRILGDYNIHFRKRGVGRAN
jgi:hypothetical protein